MVCTSHGNERQHGLMPGRRSLHLERGVNREIDDGVLPFGLTAMLLCDTPCPIRGQCLVECWLTSRLRAALRKDTTTSSPPAHETSEY